jgi:hypothetical protein
MVNDFGVGRAVRGRAGVAVGRRGGGVGFFEGIRLLEPDHPVRISAT